MNIKKLNEELNKLLEDRMPTEYNLKEIIEKMLKDKITINNVEIKMDNYFPGIFWAVEQLWKQMPDFFDPEEHREIIRKIMLEDVINCISYFIQNPEKLNDEEEGFDEEE